MKKFITSALVGLLCLIFAPPALAGATHPYPAMDWCDSYYDGGLRSRTLVLQAGYNVGQVGPIYVDSLAYSDGSIAVRFKYNTASPYTYYMDCRVGWTSPYGYSSWYFAGEGLVLTSDLPTNPQVENPWTGPTGLNRG